MGYSMSIIMSKLSFPKLILSGLLLGILTILNGQTILTATLNTPGGAGILSESCSGPYELVIHRGSDNQDTTYIFISDFGVAHAGQDYNFPPGSFPATMLPGDSILVIPINVVSDGLNEGLETLYWELAYQAGLEFGSITLETAIVDKYEVEILSSTDTIQWCRDIQFVLQATSDAEILWSPSDVFDDSTGTAATVKPHDSGWYFATVGSESCGAKDSIFFDLAIVEIANDDTAFICLGDNGVVLNGFIYGLATDFVWIPSSTLDNPNILNPIATPTVTTTYLLKSDIGVCTATDRVVVRVDSIPEDLHIDIAPFKPYYCAGEIVALFSPTFDTLDFPDLTFNWTPYNSTFTSDQDLLDAALILQDTTLYFRDNINNACRNKDSILINVVPSTVPLSVDNVSACPGASFTVEVLSDQVTDPEWTPAEGLSCTKCLNPTVTVSGTPGSTISYQFSGKILDCPVGATLTIHIPPMQIIDITGDNIVCAGDMVQLTITNPQDLTGFHWTTTGDGSFSCDDCINPVVTVNSDAGLTVFVSANTSNTNFCGALGAFTMLPGQQLQDSGPLVQACLGGTAVASTGNPDYTDIQWDVISGDLSLSCTACENPVVTVNSQGLLRYFAESSDPNVCKVIGSVSVSIYPPDNSNLLIAPDPAGGIGQGADVMASLNVSPPPASVMWTINGESISTATTTIGFNASEEINFVEAKFTNSKGCEQIDTISFHTVPPEYKIPNAFTPDNNDEINDKFRIIINGNIEVDEFLVFNRWGQLVFNGEDDPDGWDGRFKGEPAASDTYVYTAKLRFPDGETKIAKGDVILLR